MTRMSVLGVLTLLVFMSASTLARTESVEETRRLADQGDALAQTRLGLMCQTGQGLPQDLGEAENKFVFTGVTPFHGENIRTGNRMHRQIRGTSL